MEPDERKPIPIGFTMHDGEAYVALAGLRDWIASLEWDDRPDAEGARSWIVEELNLMGIAYLTDLTDAS